ncbi:hypothetical protein HDU91_004392, partial [Kappamyces sp. JEL0680]
MQQCCYSDFRNSFGYQSLAQGYPYDSINETIFPARSQIADYCIVDYSAAGFDYSIVGYVDAGRCLQSIECNKTHVTVYENDDCSGEAQAFQVLDEEPVLQMTSLGMLSMTRFRPTAKQSTISYIWTTNYPYADFTFDRATLAYRVICEIIRFSGILASLLSMIHFGLIAAHKNSESSMEQFFFVTHVVWLVYGVLDTVTSYVQNYSWPYWELAAILIPDYWMYSIAILMTMLCHAYVVLDLIWMPTQKRHRVMFLSVIAAMHIAFSGGDYFYPFWPLAADSYW